MKKIFLKYKSVIVFAIFLQFAVFFFSMPKSVDSGALTSASDTLSDSRLSYRAQVSGTPASASTVITIESSGYPDENTANLFPGDTVCFAPASLSGCKGNTTYTVGRIVDSTHFTITTGLAGALEDTDLVIASREATHTVAFTTASTVAEGSILVKIPANTNSATSNDGFPDSGAAGSDTQGFDLQSLAAADVTCAGTGPVWQTPTVTSSASSPSGEHEIVCPYTGTLSASTAVTITIGDSSPGLLKLINPAPASDHTQGTADDLQVVIEQYNHNTPASGTLIDSVDIAVAPIEGVFVSATVDETLDFKITLVTTGGTACNVTPSVSTTTTTVPFGTMSLNTFKTAAHDLQVSTNASEGYAVTAIANDQMGKEGKLCDEDAGVGDDCIPDTTCDGGTCTHLASAVDDWETNTNNGFGYSLESTDGSDAAWEYDGTSGTCDGTGDDFCAAQFADDEETDTEAPVTIMSNAGAVNSKNIYVCYRLSVGALQPAGYYYNKITYTATATF